jgi:FkbM family methyltransferase
MIGAANTRGASMAQYYSQHGQDALIGDVLFRGRTGVFVDVGARGGRAISNTKYLEEKGWTGIALEPHPDLFAMLRDCRTCNCLNIAASEEADSSVDFVKFLEEPLGNSGLVSTFRDPARLAAIKHEIISIECRPLSEILKPMPIVHYLDIDVEGHELEVLRGVNFDQTQIRVIGVEVDPHSLKQIEIDTFLSAKGFYPFMQLISDRFYSFGRDVPSASFMADLP